MQKNKASAGFGFWGWESWIWEPRIQDLGAEDPESEPKTKDLGVENPRFWIRNSRIWAPRTENSVGIGFWSGKSRIWELRIQDREFRIQDLEAEGPESEPKFQDLGAENPR